MASREGKGNVTGAVRRGVCVATSDDACASGFLGAFRHRSLASHGRARARCRWPRAACGATACRSTSRSPRARATATGVPSRRAADAPRVVVCHGASGEERTHTERQPSSLRDAQESVFGRRRGRAQARELLSEMARPGARTGRVPPDGAATGNSPSDLKTLGALLPDTFSYTSAIEASDDRVSSHSSRARSPSDNELTRRVTHSSRITNH